MKPKYVIHSYPWYTSNWRRSETRLEMNLEERGLYRELLDYCYDEGSIPNDERKLVAIVGCTEKEFRRAWPRVARQFDPTPDDPNRLTHHRCVEVLEELERWHDQKSEAGKKSARVRRERKGNDRSTSVGTNVDTDVPTAAVREFEPSTSTTSTTSTSASSPQTPNAPVGAGGEQMAFVTVTEGTTDPVYDVQSNRGMQIISKPADELKAVISEVAARIHERHPKPQCDIGVGQVAKKLGTIAERYTKAERIAAIRRVDANHADWCRCERWTKDGGQFAKGLENWLAPTMGRYEADAPPTAAEPQQDRYMDGREYLRRQDEEYARRQGAAGGK